MRSLKSSYWIAGGVLVAVVLIVLFVPGVAENIEGRLLRWLAGLGQFVLFTPRLPAQRVQLKWLLLDITGNNY